MGIKERPERPIPKRNASIWAQAFVEELRLETGIKADRSAFERIASWHPRLRERVPSSIVKNVIASSAAAGFSVEDWIKMAQRSPVLLVLKKETLRRRVPFLAKLLRLSPAELKVRLRQYPKLLCCSEKMLAKRARALREAIGLEESEWRHCLARFPDLLTYAVPSLEERARGQRELLDLTQADYRKLIVREPRLLVRGATGMTSMLKGMTEKWSIESFKARALLVRSPNLLAAGAFETLDRNLSKLAHGFEVDKEQIVIAFMRFPPLAFQKPERLIAAVKAGAALFGVGLDIMVRAALRNPSLIARKPEGWGTRMRLILRIGRALGVTLTAKQVLDSFPAALTYGRDRLLQRLVMARLGVCNRNWTSLLTLPNETAKKMLATYFGNHTISATLHAALKRRDLI